MNQTSKLAARSFGIAFLIGYLSYGIGFGFVNSLIEGPDGLAGIAANKGQLVLYAGILMAIFASINIGLAMIMTPLLKAYNKTMTYGYLSMAIASTLLLIIGAIFLLMLIPLSEDYVAAGNSGSHYETLALLLKKANFFCYQIGMVLWGIGGLMFCFLLNKARLVPKWIAIWGFVAYLIFVGGAIFALFGIPIDLICDIPGGLFEIYISIRFIAKGFWKLEK